MPFELSSQPQRLYVDPQDVRLEKVREWLLLSGLSAALHFEDPRYYFQVDMPVYWPKDRKRQFTAELTALRAEFS
jgi:hypothetical protein